MQPLPGTRLVTRDLWHKLRRDLCDLSMLHPRIRLANVHHQINDRAEYRAVLDRCVEDGQIGVHRAGMDCDCSQYSRASIQDAHVGAIAFQRAEEEHYSWLDGPETTYWLKPSETIVQHSSRDLALEAFEDGHPHVVYI